MEEIPDPTPKPPPPKKKKQQQPPTKTGSCFLVGGLIHREQRFNPVAGVANLSMLFLATLALVVPTPIGCVRVGVYNVDMGVWVSGCVDM